MDWNQLEPVRRSTLDVARTLTAAFPPAAAPAPALPPASAPAAPAPAPGPVEAPAAVEAAPAPAPVAPVAAPVPAVAAPRFVGGKIRSAWLDLDFHVEFGGRTYERIELRRPTSAEVGRYFEQLGIIAAADPERRLLFPIYFDEWGDPLPEAVYTFLDGDDREALIERSDDFLPGRLLRLLAAQEPSSTPSAGVSTEPTSST